MDTISKETEIKELDPPEIDENIGSNSSPMKITKNVIIIILASLLILSFLGVNIFRNIAIGIQNIVVKILSMVGFYTGAIINTSADIIGDTAKGGVDIAEGSIHSIGNLLQNTNNMNGDTTAQMQWNMSMFNLNPTPKPDVSNNPPVVKDVQPDLDTTLNNGLKKEVKYEPSLTSSRGKKWCPIGHSNGSGKCMQIDESQKCMFGKVFDTQDVCEQNIDSSAFKGYASQEREINWGKPPPPPPPAALTPPYQPQMFNELPGQSCGRMPPYSYIGGSSLPIINKPVYPARPVFPSQLQPNNPYPPQLARPYRPESKYSNQPLQVNADSALPDNQNRNNNSNNNSNNTLNQRSDNNYNNTANSYAPFSRSPATPSVVNNSPSTSSSSWYSQPSSFQGSSQLTSSIDILSGRVDELTDVLENSFPRPPSNSPAAGMLPPVTGMLPPAAGMLPPAAGMLPPAAGMLPPAAGMLPPVTGMLPPAAGMRSPASGMLPPVTGMPPTSAGVPPTSTGMRSPADGMLPPVTGMPPTSAGVPPPAAGVPPTSAGMPV